MRKLFFSALFFISFQSHALTGALQNLETLAAAPEAHFKLDAKAKGYVVVFLSAKCPCSNNHIPEIKSLAQKFKNYQFLAVHSNSDETREMTESYFKKADLPFAWIHDDKGTLADQLKAYKTPHAFVLSREGEIIYQGGVTNSSTAEKASEHFLKAALEDLQAGHEVRTKNGRTLGCVIAREKDQNVW